MKLPSQDIHTHILPGVDDGFESAYDAVKALCIMKENGVDAVVFTPHFNTDITPAITESFLKEQFDAFAQTVREYTVPSLSLAAEYMVVKDFEKRADDPTLLTFSDGSVLIEMSYYFPSPNLDKTIFELSMVGRKPILAHPERYLYMSGSLDDFDRYIDMGCRFQGNLLSMSGVYGPESLRIADYLLKKGYYSFVSTDLHSLGQLQRILEYSVHRQIRRKASILAE